MAPSAPPPTARRADRRASGQHGDAGGADRRAERGTRAELGRAGDEARGDAGPKMPRPNSARLASTRLIAWPMSGSWPCSAAVNSAKKFEPMPTMTASTITLMPDDYDVAEHALGEEAGAVPQREWHEDEAGEARQLELEDGDEHLHGENEEGDDHERPGEQQHRDRQEIVEEAGEAHQLRAWSSSGQAAEKPVPASRPGLSRSSAESVPPPAVSPACANERKMMSASVEKLFRMNANAPI
jgi:hypothetical protein